MRLTLDLRALGLDALPEEIGTLTTLEELDLSRNVLKQLPPSLAGLGRLSKLDLSRNQLKWFPSDLCGLASLRSLNVSDTLRVACPRSAPARRRANPSSGYSYPLARR